MDLSDSLVNGGSAPTNNTNTNVSPQEEEEDIDPIWLSSRTARQIYGLCQVEKVSARYNAAAPIEHKNNQMKRLRALDIGRLLSLAASSISLLTLPQTDPPDAALPQGAERSEQFVLVVSEYFQRLDSIQTNIRSSLAHIRQSRIAPSAINAPRSDFIPPPLGAGLPSEGSRHNFGLQEERVERDAWNAILGALTKLKAAQSQPHDDSQTDIQSSQ
ncbi:hypothetical protein BJ322DRAFT_1099164 [Thelephora terrestris]|uniref:Mediator of RNA polymerase II transcription subunit 11 n=1 Tax=Thelephora terrestris TaxID=56493 RepID=A0A9P6HGC9_9AGAM|nr:hypothetical protein BJ322DRAFT_1099164 [Thelephora terrestris]